MSRSRVVCCPLSACVVGDVLITYSSAAALHVNSDGTVVELYGFPDRRRWRVLAISEESATVQRDDGKEFSYSKGNLDVSVYKEVP